MNSIASDLISAVICLRLLYLWAQYQKRRQLTPAQQLRRATLTWEENHGRAPSYTPGESLAVLLQCFAVGVPAVLLVVFLIRLGAALWK